MKLLTMVQEAFAMRKFCIPALPLLTLKGVKKLAADSELEMLPIGDKTEVHEK